MIVVRRVFSASFILQKAFKRTCPDTGIFDDFGRKGLPGNLI
jgi:hypothetical protein